MFNGEPDRTCHLPDLRVAATENAQAQIDGFISANSYVSRDGAWVVNSAQWRCAEACQAMLANTAATAGGRMRPVGDRLGPHPYTVESVHPSNHFRGSTQ
jgi:hypothetical protein